MSKTELIRRFNVINSLVKFCSVKVRYRLFKSFCMALYGCILWDSTSDQLCGQLPCTGTNSVVCRNRNLVISVYFQSTYNYYNELVETEERRNCCFLRNINIMSDKDL